MRNKLISWENFEIPSSDTGAGESAKRRVTNRSVLVQAQHAQAGTSLSRPPSNNRVLADTIEHLKATIRSIRCENEIFPPANVSQVPQVEKALKVEFVQTESLGLKEPLIFYFVIEVFEAASKAVQISGKSYYGNGDHRETDVNGIPFFSGIAHSPGLRGAVEVYLYSNIDFSQQLASSGESDRWLKEAPEDKN